MGWRGGEERSDGGGEEYGETEKQSSTSSTDRKRSISRLQCVSLYMRCCEEMQERQSMKEMMCEKAEMQRKRLCSRWHRNVQRVDYESTPCLHLSVIQYTVRSISQMDYLPNGPWQCSFLWVVSYASNIFHSDKSERCCCHSVCFKTRFTSTYTRYYLSLLLLFIIHLCFSGDKATGRKIVTGTVCDCKAQIQIGYISFIPAPLFFFSFSERPSHQLQTNQVDHILATD